jgi:hypothetical protein
MKTIRVENLRAELAEMGRRVHGASLVEPLGQCVQPIRDGFASNFGAAAGSTGAAWPPRKPRPHDDGHPLLIEKIGALLGATQGGQGGITRVDDRLLALGVDKGVKAGGIPGAGAHNWGYPPNNLPQREFLYASTTVLDACLEIVADGSYSQFFVF